MSDITLADLINKTTKDGSVEKEVQITEEDRKTIEEIKGTIRIQDPQFITNYASNAQLNIGKFNQRVLNTLSKNNNEETTALIGELVDNINQSSEVKKVSFIKRLFGASNEETVEERLVRYEDINENVDNIKNELELYRIRLLKDIATLDILYKENTKHFKSLDLYILAGEEKAQELRDYKMKELREEAEEKIGSERDLAIQLVNDFEQDINRFEKRISDIKTSKVISMQMAPQIKLMQNNNQLLVNKITDSINNVIPLYKSQLIILLGLKNQKEALSLQQGLSNATNNVMLNNADMLNDTSKNITKESTKETINAEMLNELNKKLTEALDTTVEIEENIKIDKKSTIEQIEGLKDTSI